MTIVIGLAPGDRGEAPARLGVMLANAAGEDLLVCAVSPTPWPTSAQDEAFFSIQDELARTALAKAESIIGPQIPSSYAVHRARSVATGLTEVVQETGASVVVLGSSARGVVGLVSLGGVAERLLHSVETPVCIAPGGFDAFPPARLTRVTVGFGRADHDSGLLDTAARRADALGLRLRVACFAVRPSIAIGASIEKDADGLVVEEWAHRLRSEIADALRSAGHDPMRVEVVIGSGGTMAASISSVSWEPGDVLVIGASTSTVSRFFLGSHASKIVRSSPAPVLVLARNARRDKPDPQKAGV